MPIVVSLSSAVDFVVGVVVVDEVVLLSKVDKFMALVSGTVDDQWGSKMVDSFVVGLEFCSSLVVPKEVSRLEVDGLFSRSSSKFWYGVDVT